jgi:hypothetical protein
LSSLPDRAANIEEVEALARELVGERTDDSILE